jgi:PAS domain S-box-containing protein
MGGRALRSSSTTEAFAVVADDAPVMLWLAGRDGRRTFFNKRWLEFTGRTMADELGDGWAASIPNEDGAAVLRAFAEAARSGQPATFEYRLRRADGEFRHVIDRAGAQPARSRKSTVGCCIDITARKNITRALLASEKRFRLLAENARDMIYHYRVAPPRAVEYISPAALAITGHRPEEFYADPNLGWRAIHPDDRHLVSQAFQQDPARLDRSVLLRWVHPDGRIVFVEHRRVPVVDADGRVIAIEGVGRDVTESLAIRDRLRESESHLRRLAANVEEAREKERTLVARELHDELGQSLTAIKLELTRTARALPHGLSPEAIDGLQSIFGGIDVATETVRRLATSLRPPSLDHLGLVAAIELEAAALARRTGVRCRVVGDRRRVMRLDPAHSTAVFRIVQEALTNAIRHAGASAIRISIKNGAGSTTVSVHDNGRGITDDEIADPSAIGLVGMRERAELIGASLTVSSTPGKGTTVAMVMTSPPAGHEERSTP